MSRIRAPCHLVVGHDPIDKNFSNAADGDGHDHSHKGYGDPACEEEDGMKRRSGAECEG